MIFLLKCPLLLGTTFKAGSKGISLLCMFSEASNTFFSTGGLEVALVFCVPYCVTSLPPSELPALLPPVLRLPGKYSY
jgi:hypothetical protein